MTTSQYVDIAKLSSADFNPYTYANQLVTTINTSSDTIDLTTPLQRTLFDLQEIDSTIHSLSSQHAVEILQYTKSRNDAAARILDAVERERAKIAQDYDRLQREVVLKAERARMLRRSAMNGLEIARLTDGVVVVLEAARKFEQACVDGGVGTDRKGREDGNALKKACLEFLTFKQFMAKSSSEDIGRVNLVKTVRGRVFEDGVAKILEWARKVVREFSISSLTSGSITGLPSSIGNGIGAGTFKDQQAAQERFEMACQILVLLSPLPSTRQPAHFEKIYLSQALQNYLQNNVNASAASLARGLGQIPQLDRSCAEVAGRCQNIIAFEVVLGNIVLAEHPQLDQEKISDSDVKGEDDDDDDEWDRIEAELKALDMSTPEKAASKTEETALDLLIKTVDTGSLVSYFWRSLAASLGSKVQEILNRGGVAARTLKSGSQEVRKEIRDCVLRGSKMPAGLKSERTPLTDATANWEREAAVMVQSIVGPLSR